MFAYRSWRPTGAAATVRTATVSVSTVTEVVSGSGTVEAGTSRTLAFATSGKLLELNVKLGQTVAAGDVVAKVDPTTAQNALKQAESSHRIAEAKLATVRAGLSAAERKQLDLATATSKASVATARQSLAQTKETLAQNEKGYEMAIDQARTNFANLVETAEFSAINTQTQVDNARNTAATARATAEANVKSSATQVETARAALDAAKTTAEFNARSYQTAIDTAITNAANAKTNIELSAVSSQAQFDQAVAQLNADTAAVAQAQSDFITAQATALNAQGLEAGAKSAYDVALAAIVPPATCDSTPSCKTAEAAWKSAQQSSSSARSAAETANNKVISAQTKVTQSQNTVTNLTNSRNIAAEKDAQTLQAAEGPAVTSARQAQQVGLAKDVQTVRTAETSLSNAISAQTSGLEKDQLAIRSADQAIDTALTNQEAAAVKDRQSVRSAELAIVSAKEARTAGRIRDSQTLQSAQTQVRNSETSYASTLAANAVKLAPAQQADLESASSAVLSAQLAVDAAKETEASTTMTAPIAGTITTLNAILGETVAAGSGAGGSGSAATASTSAFAVVTDTLALRIKFGVSEANAAKLKLGQLGTISFDALPNVAVPSTIDSIDAVATTVSGVATYYAYLVLDGTASAQGVKPGMTAQIRVTVNEAVDVLTLPATAIRSLGGRQIVQLQDPTTKVATPTPIEVGVKGEGGTQILSGLAEGDIVVLPTVQATTQINTGRNTGLGGGGNPVGGGAGGGRGGGGG